MGHYSEVVAAAAVQELYQHIQAAAAEKIIYLPRISRKR
jgi:hypothetical protein